ncbi:caspase family protein [Streptacidiphilus sp. P02-A3a]|uniref:caspase family protein n=1 Tax=Streptacidiphilus sp. P02-A3a TaxID=2704468 RepID=UPI0015F9AABE|nr:caspase family protein [Streptacidiphilus sp. P02-A3a]QMU67205.1 caspase family protein [Streptacidiphilus sp. P02-A3a]
MRSRAVLIGVSGYENLPGLPGVANNLEALSAVLTSPSGWSLADQHCTVIREPATQTDVLDAVHLAADQAEDALLVYFAGHGLIGPDGRLYLGLPGVRNGRTDTGIQYELLRRHFLDGCAQRRLIILDCCYSGRALGAMSAPGTPAVLEEAEVEGTFVLTAAAENVTALALPGETFTAMTGELLDILRHGIAGGPRWLDLEAVYQQLRRAMRAKDRPEPQRRNRNTAGQLFIGANAAYRPAAMPSGSRSDGAPVPWPDAAQLTDGRDFARGLAEVRALTGMTLAEIGRRMTPPVTAGTVSVLLNGSDPPRRWERVARFLEACGMPADQQEGWRASWSRLQPPETAAPKGEDTRPPPRWQSGTEGQPPFTLWLRRRDGRSGSGRGGRAGR